MSNPSATIEATPSKQLQPVSKTYRSQQLKLHYVEWVNKDAPTLIMVHGGNDHCRNWDWVARRLNHKYNIIAPDLRGHGDSDWANTSYRVLDFIYDLNQLISVNNLKKVTLIAHSFGSWVSMLLAGLRPELVEKLVVVDGLDVKTPKERKQLTYSRLESINVWLDHVAEVSVLNQRHHSSLASMVERMQSQNTFLTSEQATHLTTHGVRRHDDGSYSWKFDRRVLSLYHEVEFSREDVFELWRKISCPVLVIQGAKSKLMKQADAEEFAQFQDYKVVNVPYAGHWPHHQNLDMFLMEVSAFLDGTEE